MGYADGSVGGDARAATDPLPYGYAPGNTLSGDFEGQPPGRSDRRYQVAVFVLAALLIIGGSVLATVAFVGDRGAGGDSGQALSVGETAPASEAVDEDGADDGEEASGDDKAAAPPLSIPSPGDPAPVMPRAVGRHVDDVLGELFELGVIGQIIREPGAIDNQVLDSSIPQGASLEGVSRVVLTVAEAESRTESDGQSSPPPPPSPPRPPAPPPGPEFAPGDFSPSYLGYPAARIGDWCVSYQSAQQGADVEPVYQRGLDIAAAVGISASRVVIVDTDFVQYTTHPFQGNPGFFAGFICGFGSEQDAEAGRNSMRSVWSDLNIRGAIAG